MDANTQNDLTPWWPTLFGAPHTTSFQRLLSDALGRLNPAGSAISTRVDDEPREAPRRAFAELTGQSGGGARPPTRAFCEKVDAVSSLLTALSGTPIDGFTLLVERSLSGGGIRRNGPISCGGATRLLPCLDGTIAISLSRATDIDSLPAFLAALGTVPAMPVSTGASEDEPWRTVERAIARGTARLWVDQAVLLDMAVGEPGETPTPTVGEPAVRSLIGTRQSESPMSTGAARPEHQAPLVVDLSSLWAGPLCSRLLRQAGMRVIKVEDVNRPDGGRLGSPEFFAALHRGKEFMQFDFQTGLGRRDLAQLLERADVVIEGSRPRALVSLGIDVEQLLLGSGPRVWTSITGHGQTGRWANRVAFGDDAAVAGGLVHREGSDTWFFGDAVADPLTGMVAAAATLMAWKDSKQTPSPNRAGRSSTRLDVAMARVAAAFSGRAPGSRGLPRWEDDD